MAGASSRTPVKKSSIPVQVTGAELAPRGREAAQEKIKPTRNGVSSVHRMAGASSRTPVDSLFSLQSPNKLRKESLTL